MSRRTILINDRIRTCMPRRIFVKKTHFDHTVLCHRCIEQGRKEGESNGQLHHMSYRILFNLWGRLEKNRKSNDLDRRSVSSAHSSSTPAAHESVMNRFREKLRAMRVEIYLEEKREMYHQTLRIHFAFLKPSRKKSILSWWCFGKIFDLDRKKRYVEHTKLREARKHLTYNIRWKFPSLLSFLPWSFRVLLPRIPWWRCACTTTTNRVMHVLILSLIKIVLLDMSTR